MAEKTKFVPAFKKNCALLLNAAVLIPCFAMSLSADNLSVNYGEARNEAMGGVGVASSNHGAAILTNPALLTQTRQKDYFSLIFPSVAAEVSDKDHIKDRADRLNSAWDRLGRSTTIQETSMASDELLAELKAFGRVRSNSGLGYSIAAAVPNPVFPVAIMLRSQGNAELNAEITDSDISYLESLKATSSSKADITKLTSKAVGRAASVTEVGIAMAQSFESDGMNYSIGITPKYQRVDTFNYNSPVRDLKISDISDSKFRSKTDGYNVDIGLTMDLDDGVVFGVVTQNIISRSIDTKEINGLKETFKIRPQTTVGISLNSDIITTALDVDLTPASGFIDDGKSQFVRVGAELNALSWFQLRAGWRKDFKEHSNSAFSAGVGISPFNLFHLDLAGLMGRDRHYGVMAQIGLTF